MSDGSVALGTRSKTLAGVSQDAVDQILTRRQRLSEPRTLQVAPCGAQAEVRSWSTCFGCFRSSLVKMTNKGLMWNGKLKRCTSSQRLKQSRLIFVHDQNAKQVCFKECDI